MGILSNLFKGNKNNDVQVNELEQQTGVMNEGPNINTSTQPVMNNTPTNNTGAISLKKEVQENVVQLEKVLLSKSSYLTISQAQVVVAIDASGSMNAIGRYSNTIAKILDKILPLGMKFDDNNSIDIFTFNNTCEEYPSVNPTNINNYTSQNKFRAELGTHYAPVVNKIIELYKTNPTIPMFVIFITDGDNFDKVQARKAFANSSELPIFFQIVALSERCSNDKKDNYRDFPFIKELDDGLGKIDNVSSLFIKPNIDDITYEAILGDEFPKWYNKPAVKRMLGK